MVNVLKRNGELAPYEPERIRASLERVGTSEHLIKEILKDVESHLYEKIPTEKIYGFVFKILKKRKRVAASKFGLKNAIVQLGPAGHHFETFIAKILEEKGYKTEFRVFFEGKCIGHEIDVVAHKGDQHIVAECKFHNQPWVYCPIQDALYTYARFLDISSNHKNKINKVMLITNTRFSIEVEKYAKCVGMELLGWKYPFRKGLEVIIDKKFLYPITVLQSVGLELKEKFLLNDYVLVKDLQKLSIEDIQKLTNCSLAKAEEIKKEVYSIISSV
ncbi:MAG: ATP cone domain-containing protein [Candidatus Micrarchaeia archaeon]